MNDYDNRPGEAELDDIFDALEGLDEQERDIEAEREVLRSKLAAHRPAVLRRIVAEVQTYLIMMGGTMSEVLAALPQVEESVPEPAPTCAPAKGRKPRTGGWLHQPTGVVYKGGKLPTALDAAMREASVDLDDKTAKKAWIEANCVKVAAAD